LVTFSAKVNYQIFFELSDHNEIQLKDYLEISF